MTVETPRDLAGLLAAGRVVAEALQHVEGLVRPGVTTAELDEAAARFLAERGARPAPALTYGFPGTACICLNDEAAHGIPGERAVQPGDLVKIDISAELGGFFADAAITVAAPPIDEETRRLCEAAREALAAGVAAARAGQPLGAVGRAAEGAARRRGFRIVRALQAHGVGRGLHEAPRDVPMYDSPAARGRLANGLVLTVEPHLTTRSGRLVELADGWTLRTADRAPVAMFEHTIVVTAGQPIVVTAPGGAA